MPATRLDTKYDTRIAVRSRRSTVSFACELVASLIVVAAVLEGIFLWAGIGEQEYLKPDSATGYSPMPGKRVTWRQEGFSQSLFNSQGMRDREIASDRDARSLRIAILGDSYVESLQVQQEDSFCQVLEKELNTTCRQAHCRVLNYGVSAYNLGQMYLRLKELAVKMHPDLVILGLRIDQSPQLDANPRGGFLFARPTFTVDAQGNLRRDDSLMQRWNQSWDGKRIKATSWLREHSRIWGVISQSLSSLNMTKKNTFVERPYTEQWPVVDGLLAAIEQLCDQHHCTLMIAALPGPGAEHNLGQLNLLRRSASKLNISLVDPLPAFDEALRSKRNLFFTWHMNEAGHRLLAQQILPVVKASLHLPVVSPAAETQSIRDTATK